MKHIKLFSVVLLLVTMCLGFTACSSDDDNKDTQESLIVGKWKITTSEGTIFEAKANKTFQFTNTKQPNYKEFGTYRVESGKIYLMFSDETDWISYKIHELNSISLIVEEYGSDGNLGGYKESYQRIN